MGRINLALKFISLNVIFIIIMRKYILYITSSLNEVYECAYSILKYLEVYNLKSPAEHALVIYSNYPNLLEAYGSFFNHFELRPMSVNSAKASIIESFKKEVGENVLYFDSNTYPVKKMDAEKSIESYKDLKEFPVLLKDFFRRYQEESVPNQVKLIHNIDAKEIANQKNKFERLPLASRWIRKIRGKGWNISNYLVRI
jgi:hypothetical protein